MKFCNYLKDNIYHIIIFIICLTINTLIFLAFKIAKEIIITTNLIQIICFLILLLIPYFRKKRFYNDLLTNIEELDKSYLVLETLEQPEFYEGKLLFQALYDINKSMNENVKQIASSMLDFKEYIGMWIHEVKIPLAILRLITNNDKRIKIELKKLEDYVEQILYYERSENAEKDYLIKETSLETIIKNVSLKNMDYILANKIKYHIENVNFQVLTDSKWLEFILGQIINNSVKYKRNIKNSYLKISTLKTSKELILIIEDNGIGIKSSDLNQVFDKSFTGENGRNGSKSTGMGLYLAKKMCQKLGHKIEIESKYN